MCKNVMKPLILDLYLEQRSGMGCNWSNLRKLYLHHKLSILVNNIISSCPPTYYIYQMM